MWQNPFQPSDPNSYLNFRAKMRQKMRQNGLLEEKIRTLLREAYEQALSESQAVLSRPERTLLYRQLSTEILTELLNETQK